MTITETMVLLDMGEKLYPELYEPFLKNADKAISETQTVSELKSF